MKIYRSLPDVIWSKNMEFKLNPELSAKKIIPTDKQYRKVYVMSKNLEGKKDLHGQYYKPSEFIFTYTGTFKLNKRRLKEVETEIEKQAELKAMAIKLYFDSVSVSTYRDEFLERLKHRRVIDKRADGFYCCYCGKFSKNPMAFVSENKISHPSNNLEIWITNGHYDGCRGWD